VIVCPICTEGIPFAAGEDANAVWERHAASGKCHPPPPPKPKCPVSGCKEKLTAINSVNCNTCGQKVCMKHRFEDSHVCVPPRTNATSRPDRQARRAEHASAWNTKASSGKQLLSKGSEVRSRFEGQMQSMLKSMQRITAR
jgi:hypothetical protein